MLLKSGSTCWRTATANRSALLVDMECYFSAAKTAMLQARRSIYFLNWAFEPDTFLEPKPQCSGPDSDRIANFLKDLTKANPDLDVRILCWKSAMPVAATQHFFPLADRGAFAHSKVKFVLDGKLPIGACHHQKMIVIDNAIAFCGGGDIGPDRWDTPEHLDDDPRREKTRRDNKRFDSRHEVMSIVDGEAARVLSELFRDRWSRATGENLPADAPGDAAAWPACVTPDFDNIQIGLSRTHGAWRTYPEVREVEALHLESIANARRSLYMENQYFTSPLIAEALARRLREADGPEVVLISTEHSPSYFDQATMDRTRSDFVAHLKAADAHGRFRAYSPVTAMGRTIIVHAKLTIVDDILLRIGSANINNRSLGFDTECDLSMEAEAASGAAAKIAELRTHLLAHWLGCEDRVMADAIRDAGGLIAGIESLRSEGLVRLRPLEPRPMNALSAIVATYHLGDPVGPTESWRPWRRRQLLRDQFRRIGFDQNQIKLNPAH